MVWRSATPEMFTALNSAASCRSSSGHRRRKILAYFSHVASSSSDSASGPWLHRRGDERGSSREHRFGTRVHADRAAFPHDVLHELPWWSQAGRTTGSAAVLLTGVRGSGFFPLESRPG